MTSKILDGYLASLNLRRSEKTISAYEETIKRFLAFNKSSEINKASAELFLIYLNIHGCSARSMNRHLAALKSFYSYLDKELKLDSYQFSHNLPVYLTEEESRKMMSVTRNPLEETVVTVLLGTGIRLSELLSLTQKDIDSDGYITVLGKGSRQRKIAVQQEVIDAIQEFTKNSKEELIFPYHRTTIQKIIQKVALRAGIERKISPHKCRHSYASAYLRHGGKLEELRDQLGHSNIKVTSIYVHTTASDRKKNLPKVI